MTYGLQHLGCEVMTFKTQQRGSVRYVYKGKDVFLWLLAGFGKSLCYKVCCSLQDLTHLLLEDHFFQLQLHPAVQ